MLNRGFIGWDIGGAHLKAAYLDDAGVVEHVLQIPCPLWQGLSHLAEALEQALEQMPDTGACHAITMTGELVDLFPNRADGVRQLLAALAARIPVSHMNVYAGEAGFVAVDTAARLVDQIASANWMATSAFIAPRVPQALFIDIGSTTTDIVPVRGTVQARGYSDYERLGFEELVYTGVVRTSVMAVADRLAFDGEWIQPMAEHFATMADVYRLCGQLPAGADQMATPDNAGKSVGESARRFARLLGRDVESAPLDAWRRCAGFAAELQLRRVADACARTLARGILDDDAPLVGAGVGRFLVNQLARRLQRPYLDFSALVDCTPAAAPWLASCAPAVAVAGLAREHLPAEPARLRTIAGGAAQPLRQPQNGSAPCG